MYFFNKLLSQNSMSWQKNLGLSMGCFLLGFLLLQGRIQNQREALADRLSPSILRFHVLADSDSPKDQQVKLEVRSLVLDFLKDHLPNPSGKEETIACLTEYQKEIESLATCYLKDQGFDYEARLQLTRCYFPTRSYGSYVFPCGYYDAARITLGKGDGHNWWCVLYPRFCFVDETCSDVPEECTSKLRQELKEDDFLALKNNRPDIEIRFLLPQLLPCKKTDGQSLTAAKPLTPQS